MTHVNVQMVLFEPDLRALRQNLASLAATSLNSRTKLTLSTCDCSIKNPLSQEQQEDLAKDFPFEWIHDIVGENLGFGKGQNLLTKKYAGEADLLWILNPDTIVLPSTLGRMLEHRVSGVGLIEARQIPFEHPKQSDTQTGETSWISGCCALVETSCFHAVGGFDELFFMYCEDVDLSWRIRALSKTAITAFEAAVYHRKRFGMSGLEPTETERTHGLASSLLLVKKYGRDRMLSPILRSLHRSPDPNVKQALEIFYRAVPQIHLATPEQKAVATFEPNLHFAKHRWAYSQAEELDD